MSFSNQKGQAVLSVVFLLFLVGAYTSMVSLEVLRATRIERRQEKQIQASWLAEAGMRKALWCLNSGSDEACAGGAGDQYTGESDTEFGQGSYTVVLTDLDADRKLITSAGSYIDGSAELTRIVQKAGYAAEVEYYSSIVSGTGGIEMNGNSQITGDIYANGPVICTAGSIDNDLTLSETNYVQGCSIGGTLKAHSILQTSVGGDAYYQEIEDSSVAGTSYPDSPDPPVAPPLISQETLDEWKTAAGESEVIQGDYLVASDENLGPVEITGDLTIDKGDELTITGFVYVHGNVFVDKNARLRLHDSFGEHGGALIADGTITSSSGSKFSGNTSGGIVLLVSTSDSEPAIDFTSGVAQSGLDVGLYSPNGSVVLGGGAKLLQVSGEKIVLDGGSKIEFSEEILTFTILESSETITFWQTVPGSRGE